MTITAVDFGTIITAADVRNAVQSTVSLWERTYLDELARLDGQPALDPVSGQPTFPAFRSWADSLDGQKFPEDQVPSCVLVVPGLTRRPEKRGSGKYTAPWAVGIGIVVGATDRARTIRLAELYTAAVRTLLLQHRSLGGFAKGVEWLGERFTEPQAAAVERTLVAGMLQFEVIVDGVLDASQGPTQPINDGATPTGWTTVATPQMGVTVYSADEEIPRP